MKREQAIESRAPQVSMLSTPINYVVNMEAFFPPSALLNQQPGRGWTPPPGLEPAEGEVGAEE